MPTRDLIFGPPAVTPAEALSEPISDDGDVALNAIVNLERHLSPFDKQMQDYQIERARQIKEIRDEEAAKTRVFCVSEVNFTKGRAEEDPEEKNE